MFKAFLIIRFRSVLLSFSCSSYFQFQYENSFCHRANKFLSFPQCISYFLCFMMKKNQPEKWKYLMNKHSNFRLVEERETECATNTSECINERWNEAQKDTHTPYRRKWIPFSCYRQPKHTIQCAKYTQPNGALVGVVYDGGQKGGECQCIKWINSRCVTLVPKRWR